MPYSFLSKSTLWRALWIAIRRAPRDKKALLNLIRFFPALVLLALWLSLYIFWIPRYWLGQGRFGEVFLAIFAVYMLFLYAFPPIRDHLEKRAQERASPSVSLESKRTLFREACLLATLLERLSSEKYLEKEIPPDIQIVTRRVLLDRLSEFGLREDLDPWLLDLLLAPDGHWTTEQKERANPAWECLIVFRWQLGLDQLPNLTSVPKYKVEDCISLFNVKRPERLFAHPSWDLRPERDAAESFFWRCWAELLARRKVSATDDSQIERALEFRNQIQEEGYTGDYIIGARTVTELKTDLLFFVAARAYYRWQFLSVLVNVTTGDASPALLREFLAHFFAPAQVDATLDAEETT